MMVDGWMLPKMRIPGDGDDEKYILLFVFFVCQRWRGVFLPRRWRIPVENTDLPFILIELVQVQIGAEDCCFGDE